MEGLTQSEIINGILLGEQAVRALGRVGLAPSGDMEQDFLEAFELELVTFPDVVAERQAFEAMASLSLLSQYNGVEEDALQYA